MPTHKANLRFNRLPLKPCTHCLIRHHALCEPLTVEQLETLHSRHFGIGVGTHLYTQGAQVTETVTLCSGWLLLYRILQNGKRQVLHIALPGDFVGPRPDSKAPLRHGAVALTDSTCCVFPPLEEMAGRYPELALRMASFYARDRASREEYLTYVARCRAHERLAFLLLDLYRRLYQRRLSRGNTMPLPLTQEDMGDALGLTSVYVSHVLHQWRKQGVIEIKKHELKILDYRALCQLAGREDMLRSESNLGCNTGKDAH